MNTPRSVTAGEAGYRWRSVTAQRRFARRRTSPQTRKPRGLILTNAVGAWSGKGLLTTFAA
jgi:hypothetical protein